jgi:hypothetical protein
MKDTVNYTHIECVLAYKGDTKGWLYDSKKYSGVKNGVKRGPRMA